MPTSEAELRAWMIGGLDGDATAHATLLGALVPVLRNFYRRRLPDAAEAEDLVQDVLIAVHSRRATYDRERSFTAWLFAIARYKLIDHYRRIRPSVPIDDVAELLSDGGFEDAANARLDVDALLETLPPKQARAIRATKLDGASVADAAAAAGIGESDTKVSVHRGLKALAARVMGQAR